MSWNQGVTDLIVTPHFSRNLDPERLADCFETVRNTAEKVTPGLHLFLGQEILYFEEMVDCLLQGKALTLAESRYVYAFQDFNDIPGTLPEGRTKPWGTGQAVLAAKDVIKTPFIVINADDYYGKEGFKEFFEKEVPDNPLKAEHLIPIFIGELLEQGKMSVKVLKTNDIWYGMTYHEDVAAVKDSFKKMLADGMYKADLFSDL